MAGAEFKRMLCDGAAMRALGLGRCTEVMPS